MPAEFQVLLAFSFFHENFSEDKIAGILLLENYLPGETAWITVLEGLNDIFNERLIFD